MGRPVNEDCSEHGFFMIPDEERARAAMSESRRTLDMPQVNTVSYWKPESVERENGVDQ